jgi:uncharacterized lipoprotein YmbA
MTRIQTILSCLAAVIAFGHLVSCSGLEPSGKSLYAIDAGQPAPPRDAATAATHDPPLQVRRVNIAPPFDGLSLVSREADGTYAKDSYSEWIAPPEELFSTELVDWLSASGSFGSVVDGRSAAPHRYSLETCISSLYGDFQDPHKPRVVLTARVYLLDEAMGNRSIAYQNHYDISVPVTTASAQQLVLGSGRAYRQLLESLTQDLSAYRKTAVAVAGK